MEIEVDGEIYEVEIDIHDGVVTVHGDSGSESTQQGNLPVDQVIRLLVRSLIRNGKIKPVDRGLRPN